MSHQSNTDLETRASDAAEDLQSHPSGLDRALLASIKKQDYDELLWLVNKAEALLSQEHFYDNALLRTTDAY